MLYDPSKEYDEAGKVLLKAAQYIEEHGHCRGKFQDKKGRVCLLGAIRTIAAETPDSYTLGVSTQVFNAVKKNCPRELNEFYTLVDFNDDRKTKAQDIIDLLRKSAETCKVGTF